MSNLIEHPWPGNIRELENLIERMVILRRSDHLTKADLPPEFDKQIITDESPTIVQSPNEGLTFHEAEKKLIVEALSKSAGNKSLAAKNLKIPRHVLVYRMKKYDLFYDSAR
jgi:two-component system NtrC family response regulator